MASSRRSAFSLRLRYLRTPAASSMIARRSSGRALSTASICPWLTMTCCWRPTRGIGEQLLDVEQATRNVVDGVLAVAVAEQRPLDGDLGELDRQDAGGVVDGEADLGTPERRAARRAGEDDVVHLLAADGGRSLGAEHPGDGVDDVGLTGAVGADDDGDPRLELEGRGLGEGFEPLEGQRSQEHGGPEATGCAVAVGDDRPVPASGEVSCHAHFWGGIVPASATDLPQMAGTCITGAGAGRPGRRTWSARRS